MIWRARSTSTRAPYAGAASVRALAAPASLASAARKPPRADGVLRAARHSHSDVAGWRYAPRQADRPAACVIDHSIHDRHAVSVGLVARTAPGDDKHAPPAVERRRTRGRTASRYRDSKDSSQRGGADGMADHWNPRLAAPSRGAWLWSFSLFFIMNEAIVASLTQQGAAWLPEGARRKKGLRRR